MRSDIAPASGIPINWNAEPIEDRDEHLIAFQAEVLRAVRDGEHGEQCVHDVRTDS